SLARFWPQPGSAWGGGPPARTPPPSGDRATPTRRPAVPLARLARSGALPLGSVPNGAAAARRALPRARAATLSTLQEATLRLHAFVRSPAIRYAGRAHWGPSPPAVALGSPRSDRGSAHRLADSVSV